MLSLSVRPNRVCMALMSFFEKPKTGVRRCSSCSTRAKRCARVHVRRLTDFSGQLKGFNYSPERCLRSFVQEVAAKHAQLDAKSSVTPAVCWPREQVSLSNREKSFACCVVWLRLLSNAQRLSRWYHRCHTQQISFSYLYDNLILFVSKWKILQRNDPLNKGDSSSWKRNLKLIIIKFDGRMRRLWDDTARNRVFGLESRVCYHSSEWDLNLASDAIESSR